ncbi:BgTH12-01667 [Blumeria graminis f. sp. triticale]|uniref:Bgt-5484 n=3 Tax=Blumeria graminis TaxID=34373 RepID=A0A381L2R3_BLUGR|nr:Nuclear actin-related protein [Blumeria graminis f. sp. tritici 96224]CAD6501415.1 BgTH12-01667 [Blumeria graminis f. sp. triticale]VDB83911.1 Bgt-5484 [Blumeria graminis f. sp. tritici]
MNSSTQPTDVYGGDEVAAIILDPGYSSVRAGFAGEDTPKSFLNSYYGRTKDGRNLFGDDAIHNPLVELEIQNPMSNEGIVEDWDVATKLWEYAVTSRLTSYKPSKDQKDHLNDDTKDMDTEMEGVNESEKAMEEHPLLLTETAWNTTKNREKSIEVAMESWGCPAFWLARNSVLSGFGAGKATALIVDIGASTSSTVAIHDGLILKKSIQKSPLAGNWLSSQIRILFSLQNPPVNIIPHFMIASKVPVEQNAPSQATFRQPKITHTESFRSLEQERVITEFKESVVQVWPGPTRLNGPAMNGGSNYDIAKSQPGRIFEFPDGSNRTWGAERFSVAEGFYDEKAALLLPGETQPSKAQTLPEMVKASVSGVDMDIRASLLQNIVVVGGTSLTLGLVERLDQELKNIYPGARIKINAAGLTSERRFGSWIGGSILGSLGTFHQMWISRKEYDEFGANIVEKRCK